MTTTILPQLPTVSASGDNALAVAALVEQAKDYAQASKAENTRRAYEADWRDFSAFCRAQDVPALPASPETVGLYVTAIAERVSVATVRRRLAAIASRHREAGVHPSPTVHPAVQAIVRGIVRTKGSAPRRKAALTLDLLRPALLAVAQGDDLRWIPAHRSSRRS